MLQQIEAGSTGTTETSTPGTDADAPRYSRKAAAPDAGRAQQQFADTERAYGGRAAYDRAKAAGNTRLTYGQWVQVRTPSFKQWFGDWEAVRAKDALQGMEPLIIAADEVLQSGTIAEARVRAKAMYAALKPASTVDGRRVQFPMSGFKETMQHAADRRVLLAMPQLPGLIGQAVPLWVEASTKMEKPNVRAFRHYGVKAAFPDGDALVRIVLREDNDGHVYYDNDATTVEALTSKKAPADNHQPDRKPKPGEDAEGLSNNRLAQWWNSVNPAEVSKVIDPQTGEPLAVYHGTPEPGFSSFDEKSIGRNTGKATPEHGLGGFYFTPSPDIADTYARTSSVEFADTAYRELGIQPQDTLPKSAIYPVFLNISNPLEFSDGPISADRAQLARKQGRDGIVKNGRYPELVVFNPAQIKSATGNSGEFSADTDDIRFSLKAGRATPRETPPDVQPRKIREPPSHDHGHGRLRRRLGGSPAYLPGCIRRICGFCLYRKHYGHHRAMRGRADLDPQGQSGRGAGCTGHARGISGRRR